MGTRSLTAIQDHNGKEIVVIYRQFDGYISGHGKELADFCKELTLVNGLSGDDRRVANGMGCLAAQIVAHLKTGPGGIYLHSAGIRDCWEDYIYTIYPSKEGLLDFNENAEIRIKVNDRRKQIFDGTAIELSTFKEPQEDD